MSGFVLFVFIVICFVLGIFVGRFAFKPADDSQDDPSKGPDWEEDLAATSRMLKHLVNRGLLEESDIDKVHDATRYAVAHPDAPPVRPAPSTKPAPPVKVAQKKVAAPY